MVTHSFVEIMTLRRVNKALSLILVALAAYIIIWPFLPKVDWWVKHDAPILSAITAPKISVEQIPSENTLIIPELGLKEKILEGESVYTVNKGVWRRPQTSSPDVGGNTVLVGHRFTYSGQSVFYNLDKVKKDDQIVVYWNGQKHTYKVTDIVTVSPQTIEVEAPTSEPVLTLYTCAPLLTAKDRLVIRAVPI